MLRRIVAVAAELVDARYGALGVLDETKTELAQFIAVGLDDDTYRAIGDLPHGQGILGLLILDPKPLRLPDLREHPDSYGFPPRGPGTDRPRPPRHTRVSDGGPRHQVLALAREAAGSLGFQPQVTFDGPVDTILDGQTAAELLATLREALSNVARHAGAGRVDIDVEVDGDVVLRVRDNGGIGDEAGDQGYGLRNMAERAERLGGHFAVGPAEGGGTVVEWRVPAKPAY